MEDWLTVASPATTLPSSGIILPVRTTTRSPCCTSVTGTSTSVPLTCSQTLSTLRLMAPARSATDFLCVHSSRISPNPQHEHDGAGGGEVAAQQGDRDGGGIQHGHGQLAVPQGLRALPDVRTERNTASAVVTGTGRNSLEMHRRMTVTTSLSSNSRFSARGVCSGTSASASALAKEKDARAANDTAAARV